MRLFKHSANVKKSRNRDIWFETGKASADPDVLKSVKVMAEVFQNAVIFKVKEGVYRDRPAASGTKNKTQICYARFDTKTGLYFTALDQSLICDFVRSLVNCPGSKYPGEEAQKIIDAHICDISPELVADEPGYLHRAFAEVLKQQGADEVIIHWLNDTANLLNSATSMDDTKKYLQNVQTAAKENAALIRFFENKEKTLPWSLGVRMETSLQPLYDFYLQLIAGKSEENISTIQQQLLLSFGKPLELQKIIDGKTQPNSEFFAGEPGKTPFDLKENDGKFLLRLSLMKITEKFAGGYVQVATDLLGLNDQVAISTPELTRERNLAVIQTILNLWEQSVSNALHELDLDKATPVIIDAFNLTVDKREIIQSALASCKDLLNNETGELNAQALNQSSSAVLAGFHELLLEDDATFKATCSSS